MFDENVNWGKRLCWVAHGDVVTGECRRTLQVFGGGLVYECHQDGTEADATFRIMPHQVRYWRGEAVYHEDYCGPRWMYGMTHRPPAIGALPQGRIVGADNPEPVRQGERVLCPFGTVEYPFELTAHEVRQYEMVLLAECL